MSRINYRADDLRALLALHRTNSFVRAAALLHITQSAFSRRIAQLEIAVGGRLVERTTRNVAISTLGLDLVREARPLLEGLDNAMDESGRRARGESGRIFIACLTTVAFALLPKVLDAFRKDFPEIRLQLRDDTAQRVITSVMQREAEFGIGVLPESMAGLLADHIIEDRYMVAFGPGHPLARKTQVNWSSLRKWRPVALRTTSTQHIDEQLAIGGIQPPWFDEVEHFSSLLGLLTSQGSVGVVPELALSSLNHGLLQVRPLVKPRLQRRIALVRRSDAELGKPAQVLWALFGDALDAIAKPARKARSIGSDEKQLRMVRA